MEPTVYDELRSMRTALKALACRRGVGVAELLSEGVLVEAGEMQSALTMMKGTLPGSSSLCGRGTPCLTVSNLSTRDGSDAHSAEERQPARGVLFDCMVDMLVRDSDSFYSVSAAVDRDNEDDDDDDQGGYSQEEFDRLRTELDTQQMLGTSCEQSCESGSEIKAELQLFLGHGSGGERNLLHQ